jgi:hypothetical protein
VNQIPNETKIAAKFAHGFQVVLLSKGAKTNAIASPTTHATNLNSLKSSAIFALGTLKNGVDASSTKKINATIAEVIKSKIR